MKNNFVLLSGVIGAVIGFIAYFIFSTLNPEYDHFTKAFSELGSVGQPNNLWYAVFGFFIPGTLVMLFFLNVKHHINNGNVRAYPFVLIATSGWLTAVGAAPMNYQNFNAITSLLHIAGVMGGGLFFMVGAFTISWQLKKDINWKGLIWPLLALAWLLIVSGFFRTTDYGGLAQKIGIFGYYLYVATMSWKAYKLNSMNVLGKTQ